MTRLVALVAALVFSVGTAAAADLVAVDDVVLIFPSADATDYILVPAGTPGEVVGVNGDGVILVRFFSGVSPTRGTVRGESQRCATLTAPVDWSRLRYVAGPVRGCRVR
jgi:hypothetical protein